MGMIYEPGDDLVFQLESGFGLMRVLAADETGGEAVWHVLVYADFYLEVDDAEAALSRPETLRVSAPHLPLTERALERTPAARLAHRPVTEEELAPYREWLARGGTEVFDRSVLQMLGVR